jgi:hypothetical protein
MWWHVAGKCPRSVPWDQIKRLASLQALDFPDGAEGDRTPDLMTASHALSHLSYSPDLSAGQRLLNVQDETRVVKSPERGFPPVATSPGSAA